MADSDLLTLHILADPSGAYLCLDFDLVCSHRESLFTKIVVAHQQKMRLRRSDESKWHAFEAAPVVEQGSVRIPVLGLVKIVVRETAENIIHGTEA